MSTSPGKPAGALSGAAFLMAVSAIGPGFLTQTTQFTAEIGASLAFAILVSIVIDIGAQLNTWRVVCISGRPAQEVAGAVLPGMNALLTIVIVAGAFAFNIGNLNGCALGLEALCELQQVWGVLLSALLAAGLFLLPAMLQGLDWFSKVLGVGMIAVTLYVVFVTRPPLGEAAQAAVLPSQVDFSMVVTLVGGTVGGYIMFSGAHRLLAAGITGPERAGLISWASVQGIVITGIMRVVLFLAVFGVVRTGATLSRETPVFDAFRAGAGDLGYYLSGLVFWAAAITSVVGCSYTSITFLPRSIDARQHPRLIVGFILASTLATLALRALGWQATPLLIAAGTVNGVLLPVVLGVVLLAAYRPNLMGNYRQPWWVGVLGVVAWLGTVFVAYRMAVGFFASL